MSIQLQIKSDMMLALKEKRKQDQSILSTLYSNLQNKALELRLDTLEDKDSISVIQKFLKALEDEIEAFKKVNRTERVELLTSQYDLIKNYLPKMLSAEEIKEIISKLEDKTIKGVMSYFKTNYSGKVDMSLVSKIAKE